MKIFEYVDHTELMKQITDGMVKETAPTQPAAANFELYAESSVHS